MKKTIFLILLLCAAIYIFPKNIAYEMKNSEKYKILDNIHKMNTVTGDNVFVGIFETGGGDPVFNGNIILINVKMFGKNPADFRSFYFETSINVYEVLEVRIKKNKVFINCTEHTGKYIKKGKIPKAQIIKTTYIVTLGDHKRPIKSIRKK